MFLKRKNEPNNSPLQMLLKRKGSNSSDDTHEEEIEDMGLFRGNL